ncbi:hypothetical protein GCM10011344_38730 [Dokdonia pacifica]|uniref:Uncharacterized protein n=2 Tax=Dokdonia pacifica TaxID=1627892 RepID=A0A238ZZG8_9FLAO|nr:hypothetical protein GCM10011344_38730 [Dokdonia pacifica]SNR88787.1 hypothetical protein SAMN06265376_10449 [Dokdonia pacifica]
MFINDEQNKNNLKTYIMANELWGTFSIYDHRDAIFRKSLITFDRIVIPIPNKPIGNQTLEELEQLYADASYLEKNDAAIIYNWNSDEFQDWQKDVLREALSVKSTDSFYDSRLMLQEKTEDLKPQGVNEITSLPVYGAKEEFLTTYSKLNHVTEEGVIIELSQLISIPDKNAPLEEIIALRNSKSFISAKEAFKEWQLKKMPEVLGEKSIKNINLAKEEFEKMLHRYEEEINNGKFKKSKAVVTSLLALGSIITAAFGETQTAIALISGAAPNLFSLKETTSPIWKDLRGKSYEAAGIIYEANRKL